MNHVMELRSEITSSDYWVTCRCGYTSEHFLTIKDVMRAWLEHEEHPLTYSEELHERGLM